MQRLRIKSNRSKRKQRKKIVLNRAPNLILDKRILDINIPQRLYSRTGQTAYSWSSSGQLFYLNLGALLQGTTQWQQAITSQTANTPLYETFKVTSVTFKWNPASLIQTTGVFEQQAFNVRYIKQALNDNNFNSGYAGHNNPVHLECLIQQTNRQQQFTINFSNRNNAYWGSSGTVVPNFGDEIAVEYLEANPQNLNGIFIINQPVPTLNTGTTYNPSIGYFDIDMVVVVYNSLV